MATKTSPVTPSVLAWAVDEDGRDLLALSEALDVDPDILGAWVNGEDKPSQGQVTTLAKVLKRPRALFFMPRPPTAVTLPASFRHPPGDERLVGPDARRRVRQARRIQQAVAWALRDEPPVDVPQAMLDDSAERAAEAARLWLGVTEAQQASWRNDYEALYAWRAALDSRGILVFALEIGRNDVRGFSAWDDRAPLIVTNSVGMNPAARCYTLVHELGHLLLRQDAACIEAGPAGQVSADVERWCERFGAAVLMPRTVAGAWAEKRGLGGTDAGIEDVKAMMTRFRVSARAAALRLIALGLAPRELYAEVTAVFAPKPPVKTSNMMNPPRFEMRQRQYGERTLRTVLNELPPRDALSILRLEVEDVRRLAEKVPGVREI